MFKNVIKRDGRRRKFNPSKIILAIKNTLVETKEENERIRKVTQKK